MIKTLKFCLVLVPYFCFFFMFFLLFFFHKKESLLIDPVSLQL